MPIVEKKALRESNFRRRSHVFPNARSAFAAFLKAAALQSDEIVLLPSYIGWSAREGSGVFDPVQSLQLRYAFYQMDRRLRIDLKHLELLLKTHRVKVLVLIHYFGHVDPAYDEAVATARRYGALVLEDEAHAMLTDLVGGVSGRAGDACLFSLHKILPLNDGGMLVVNPSTEMPPSNIETPESHASPAWDFDLHQIAFRRRQNLELLEQLLEPLRDHVEPLWDWSTREHIPQTYPVLIQNVSRDQLYADMNEAGFGVVSLYHTMIDQIDADVFSDSHTVARRIMNLPIHQDIEPADLERLVRQLDKQIAKRL